MQSLLANISVAANATTVTNANITINAQQYTSYTPLGIVKYTVTNSQVDIGVAGGTVQTLSSVPVVAGRAYLIHSLCAGQQVTNTSSHIYFDSRTSDGILTGARFYETNATVAAGVSQAGSGTVLWLPTSTGSYDVTTHGFSSASAWRSTTNACQITVVGIGSV